MNHGWKDGVSFTVIEEGDAIILKPAIARKTTKLEEVIGCAGFSGPAVSLADMDAGVLEEARRQVASWSR